MFNWSTFLISFLVGGFLIGFISIPTFIGIAKTESFRAVVNPFYPYLNVKRPRAFGWFWIWPGSWPYLIAYRIAYNYYYKRYKNDAL